MAAMEDAALLDMLNTTLAVEEKHRFVDISMSHQKYFAMPMLMRKDHVHFKSGKEVGIQLKKSIHGVASSTGAYDQDVVAYADIMARAVMKWAHQKAYIVIDKLEDGFQADPENVILDLVVPKRFNAYQDLGEMQEIQWWGAGDPADQKISKGLRYFIVWNAVKGFFGQNAPGFAACAGLDSSAAAYAMWRNWTDTYAAVSKVDLIAKVVEAIHKTGWESIYSHPELSPRKRSLQIYVNWTTYAALLALLETQDLLRTGSDVWKERGQVYILGVPVHWVPKLDTDQQDPVIGVDWNTWHINFQTGQFYRVTKFQNNAPGFGHNTLASWIDVTYQPFCYDRKRNFIIQKAGGS